MSKKISVLIPTYKNPELLINCLRCLEEQTVGKDFFEVVIINNDVDEDIVLPTFNLDIKVVKESIKGSYAARNSGVKRSQGNLLVFTDDDCSPWPDWLEEIMAVFSKVNVKTYMDGKAIVAGRVKMVHPQGLPSSEWNIWNCYDYFFGINQSDYVKKNEGATANLSVLKSGFKEVGGFNQDFFSGGDVDFCRRAYKLNYKIIYAPLAVVEHPLRGTSSSIKIKAKRLVGGKYTVNKYKAALFSFSPPVVRFWLLHRKEAPFKIKAKAFVAIVYLKFYQAYCYSRLLLGLSDLERR